MEKVTLLERFHEKCSAWRFRCPVEAVEALQYEGSKYSPEFDVGGVMWRLHLQQRVAPQTSEVFFAVHLQCCSATGAYAHFKITVCNRDPQLAKSKTFHCHFKKSGSAWGLHHFVPLERLLHPDGGFVEEGGGYDSVDRARRSQIQSRCIVVDVILNVLEQQPDGSYALGQLPQSAKTMPITNNGLGGSPAVQSMMPPSAVSNPQSYSSSLPRGETPRGGQKQQYSSSTPNSMLLQQHQGSLPQQDSLLTVKAPLLYPFSHLEVLCDMFFDVGGVRLKAHRCVIGCRMSPILPKSQLPLKEGTIIDVPQSMEVFAAFLRYVYTEEYPEPGVLRPESLLDLYLLGSKCEFFDLCGVCLRFVRPMLSSDNILPIVLTRYDSGDEILTSLYLRVLLDHYDSLILDKQFEEIPGHLFRKLSLILRDKEKLPAVTIPQTRNTLGKQLASLAESNEYSDFELDLGAQMLPCHRYIIASRSVVFSKAFNSTSPGPIPTFRTPEFGFSFRSWQKFLTALYRRHIETHKDFSAEDIALVYKMDQILGLDGQLKLEAEQSVNINNALRVLIYSVKHSCKDLTERSMGHVSSNFHALIRSDPQAWELIAELPQDKVLTLFRTVVEMQR